MNDLIQARCAIIFREWERRYRETPDEFMTAWQRAAAELDEYGAAAAAYFAELGAELDAAGALPAAVAA